MDCRYCQSFIGNALMIALTLRLRHEEGEAHQGEVNPERAALCQRLVGTGGPERTHVEEFEEAARSHILLVLVRPVEGALQPDEEQSVTGILDISQIKTNV